MPPPRTTRRSRTPEGKDRREQILDAALVSFVQRGFYGTAIPDIAAAADIAAGTIYHYFESKEALVNALYRKWKTAVMQRVFTAFPPNAQARKQFEIMWNEMVKFAMAEPRAFAFIELHNHVAYLDGESQAIDRTIKDFGAAVIRRAQAANLVKPLDPYILMELVFGAFVGMMRAHWEGRIKLSDQVLRAAEQACWDAVAVTPPAESSERTRRPADR